MQLQSPILQKAKLNTKMLLSKLSSIGSCVQKISDQVDKLTCKQRELFSKPFEYLIEATG